MPSDLIVNVPYLPTRLAPAEVAVVNVPVDLLVTVVTNKVSPLLSVSLLRTLPEPIMVAVISEVVLVL